MACKKITGNPYKVCIGDLRNRIEIQYAISKPNNSPNGKATSKFVTLLKTWAMVKTRVSVNSSQFFDQVNIAGGEDTNFFIRFTSLINFQRDLWVLFNGNRLHVLSVENIDGRSETIRLGCTTRGDSKIKGNQR